jgi:Kef-type K+ transport system membrane component KefB
LKPRSAAFCAAAIAGAAVFGLTNSAPAAAAAASAPPSETRFLAALVVILVTSRLLGEGMQRLGQPAVIGQLIAGILLGPSFFGLIWPAGQEALFSADLTQKSMLDGMAHFGVLLLLLLTGMDTDVGLIRRIGRPAITVSLAGIAIPFLCGV